MVYLKRRQITRVVINSELLSSCEDEKERLDISDKSLIEYFLNQVRVFSTPTGGLRIAYRNNRRRYVQFLRSMGVHPTAVFLQTRFPAYNNFFSEYLISEYLKRYFLQVHESVWENIDRKFWIIVSQSPLLS